MLKLFSILGVLAATPLTAQNCELLCDIDNWMTGDPQFILDAIANGEDVNAMPEGNASALAKAIMFGPIEMVQPLLEASADPNITDSNGLTALLAAANAPDTGTLSLLIAAGANVSAANARGQTALHFAAAGLSTPQYLPLLLSAGAEVNAADAKGNTPMHTLAGVSTMFGEPYQIAATAGFLLNSQIDLNLQNSKGETALHIAAKGRKPILVSMLLNAGANGSILDANGRTAFAVAEELMRLDWFPQVWAALEAAQ